MRPDGLMSAAIRQNPDAPSIAGPRLRLLMVRASKHAACCIRALGCVWLPRQKPGRGLERVKKTDQIAAVRQK